MSYRVLRLYCPKMLEGQKEEFQRIFGEDVEILEIQKQLALKEIQEVVSENQASAIEVKPSEKALKVENHGISVPVLMVLIQSRSEGMDTFSRFEGFVRYTNLYCQSKPFFKYP